MPEPFYFKTNLRLIYLLGVKAKNLQELSAGIKTVPLSSIYYHTHRLLYQQLALYPEPPNDFAYWVNQALNIKELGEAMASINIIRFRKLEELKSQFIKMLDTYIKTEISNATAPDGQEFHFMSCQSFIIATPYVANNIDEFCAALQKISINSLYFHIIESRLRLNSSGNDFSLWFRSIGEERCAYEIERLDPYTMTLEGLRRRLLAIIKRYARH